MAMFHLCIKVCSKRGAGKSSVAAAAYRACEAIEDDRTGITYDYTKKGGHVYGEINLCKNAPAEYQDRTNLWNAVEKIEKNKNAQTSREVEVSLPRELDLNNPEQLEQAKELLRGYIKANFVDKGMCADWNIHNPDEDNHNPHCHIMLTMRPIKANGEWGDKEKKAYKELHNDNIERLYAAEGKNTVVRVPEMDEDKLLDIATERLEWGTEKIEAVEGSLSKMSKAEKKEKMQEIYNDVCDSCRTVDEFETIQATVQKIGAKNRKLWERELVDSTGWNDHSLAEEWRKDWADRENDLLEKIGIEDRVDYRSYERQGIDKVPTIHEGVANHLFERTNGNDFSDRLYENVKIEEINSQMSVFEKIMAFCKEKIEIIKDRIEAIKDRVASSIEDTKDFLAGLVRGDNSDGSRKTDGAGSYRTGSPGLRPAFAGDGGEQTEDIIREAKAAVSGARADARDTELIIEESKIKADGAIADRADRDFEYERPESERIEEEAERDYWDDFER